MIRALLILIFLSVGAISNAQIITTFAGGGVSIGTDGIGDGLHADSASVYDPNGEAFDKYGNFYFTENLGYRVRKIDTLGIITTVAGNGSAGYSGDGGLADTSVLNQPADIACDTFGNLYIADEANNRIRKIDAVTGIITTIAGVDTGGYSGDGGPAVNAALQYPVGICIDKAGNIYISDFGNFRVRKIDTAGIITTVAGSGTCCFGGDGGPADSAQLWLPVGLAVDDTGNLYITDVGNERVRKVDTNGIINTIAGDGSYMYNGDGDADTTNIDPYRINFDNAGKLWIVDTYNNRVRRLDAGVLHTVVGNGGDGYSGDGGAADSAQIGRPAGLVFDQCGNLYVSEVNIPRIRKVIFNVPSISISAIPAVALCTGTSVTYTAAATGSSAFSYQWLVNGSVVSTAGSTYTDTPANGDSIRCIFIGTPPCSYMADTVSSNSIIMSVSAPVTPSITITANPTDTICSGAVVIYNAAITHGGTSPTYQWYVNSTAAATTSSYSFAPTNGDTIICQLTSNATCAEPATAVSNSIIMDVIPTGSSSISISGPGAVPLDSPVTITATVTGAGSSYIIVWYNHSIVFDTTTTPSLTFAKDTGTDDITAQVIPLEPCINASYLPQPITIEVKSEGVSNIFQQPITIYPNPTHDHITITGSISNILLSNTIGQTLITQQASTQTTTINISTLPTGIYLLTVTNNEGEKIVSKIVKE